MAPIQALLITLVLVIGGFYLTSLSSRLASRMAVLLFLAASVFFVINPELTTHIARALGVGRGADLLLYLFCLSTVTVFLKLYKKNRILEEKLTEVARQVALLGARAPEIAE